VVATKAFAELLLKCFVDFATEVLLKLQLVATEAFFCLQLKCSMELQLECLLSCNSSNKNYMFRVATEVIEELLKRLRSSNRSAC
jgi:hypothetical protein